MNRTNGGPDNSERSPSRGELQNLLLEERASRIAAEAEAERLRAAIEKTIDPWDEKHGPLVDPVPPYVQELRGTLS